MGGGENLEKRGGTSNYPLFGRHGSKRKDKVVEERETEIIED